MLNEQQNKQTRTKLDFAVYLALRMLITIIQAVDMQRADRYCQLFASLFIRFKIRSKLIHENLQRVFPAWQSPQIATTQHGMWLHLLRLICEIAQAPRKIHRTNWYEHFRIPNRPKLLSFIFDSRPKLIVTGHFGNFEIAGFLNGKFGLPSSTIARELDNAYLHDFIESFRSTGGQHFISKNSGAAKIQQVLDGGDTLVMLADQDAGKRGVWVDFLGHPASCHKALALFTLSSGAPMMVVCNRRLAQPLQFELQRIDSIDPDVQGDARLDSVEAVTRWYNGCLEQSIRENPSQYWWVHRRWREPPARLRKKASHYAA